LGGYFMNEVLMQITTRLNAAPNKMQFLNWLFDSHKERALTGMPVVLFGTGSLGRDLLATLKKHNIFPVSFCNSDSSKRGSLYCGLPVISIDELKKLHQDSLIVIATQTHAAAVKKGLLDNGFRRDRILWPKEFDMALALYFSFTNQTNLGFLRTRSPHPLDVLIKNEQKVLDAYNLFADQKSKELFIAKLAFMVSNENLGLFRYLMLSFSEPIAEFGLIPFPSLGPENYFYFNNDVFSLCQDEVYVDVGAFDGDSVTGFVQACNNLRLDYRHIYAFEPDPQNYAVLMQNTGDYKNISFHRLGIWSQTEVLRFESSEKACAPTACAVTNTGDIEIQGVSLDAFLNGEEVTFIKMDPPGNILPESIRGAAGSIAKYQPKLVLGAYHSLEAIFEVPLLVKSICPEYKLYLRHLSWAMGETDLFAVV
jgi:FkbM family methyltransferase